MTVLALPAKYFPPLTPSQTSATGDAAALVAKLLREVLQHERHKATDWRLAIRAKVKQLALECSTQNWDSYGAAAIATAATQHVLDFVDVLPADVGEPQVVPDPDGDVSLSWDSGTDRVFTISMSAAGIISYAGILGTGVQLHGQEPFRGDVAKILVESIRAVSSSGPASS